MISATILAVVGFTLAAPAPQAGYAPDTIRALRGHHSLPATTETKDAKGAAPVCHPDPLKGRACRHHHAKAEQSAAREALAVAKAPAVSLQATAR